MMMFEIPDDDDLFSEDNLGDIFSLKEVRHNTAITGQQTIEKTSSHHPRSHNPGLQFQSDTSSGSPQNKKIRVLADVNHQTKNYGGTATRLKNVACDGQQEESRVAKPSIPDADSISQVKPDVNHLTPHLQCHGHDAPGITRRRSLRKFPGPAGILPPVKPEDLVTDIGKNTDGSAQVLADGDNGDTSKPQDSVCSSQTGDEVFGGAAWQMLLTDLEPDAGDVLRKFSVRAMLHKASRRMLPKGKVPLMLGILDSIDFQSTDASVVLHDPTGQMQGTLHRDVFKDFSTDLQPGAAIVLRQVSVISLSPRTHYLNITAGNIVVIYPGSGDQPVLPASPDQSFFLHSSSQGRMKSFVQAAEIEMLEAANAAKEAALNKLRHKGSSPSPACGQGNSRLFGQTPRSYGQGKPRLFGQTPGSYGQGNPRPFGQTPGSNCRPGLFTPPQRGSRLDVPSLAQQPGSRDRPFMCKTASPGTQNQMMTPVRASTSGTPVRAFSSGALTPVQGIQTAGSGRTSTYSDTRTPDTTAGMVNNPHARNHIQSTSSVKSTTVTSQFCTPPVCSASDTNNSAHAQLVRTANSSTFHPQTQSRSECQAPGPQSQQSKWSFKRKASTDTPVLVTTGENLPVSGVTVNSLTKSWVQQPELGEVSGKVQHCSISGSGSSSQLAKPGSDGSAVRNEDRAGAAVISAGVDVTGIMWDEELSDDILTQLSDDF